MSYFRPRAPVLVLGIGNPLRSDDGIGPVIAEACARRLSSTSLMSDAGVCENDASGEGWSSSRAACNARQTPGCDVLQLDGESTRVIEAWRDRELALVVDAVCLGAPAGTIHDLVLDAGTLRLLQDRTGADAVSSHYAGIAEAISLGTALDRMPRSMRIIGIEPNDFSYGVGFSNPVAQAIAPAIECVISAAQSWEPDGRLDADMRL